MKSIVILMVLSIFLAVGVYSYPIYLIPIAPHVPLSRPSRAVQDNSRVQRQAGGGEHHEVVDYGAHTGHHGAFGWYADFPIHGH